MGFFSKFFGGGSGSRRITAKNPLVIKSPTIGFLNLIGPDARPLVEEDRAVLSGLFSGETTSEDKTPHCDVLFVYAVVTSDGRIEGKGARLRDIINETNASIVAYASENDPKGYIAAGKQERLRTANLVLTIERKGIAFGKFFSELFWRHEVGNHDAGGLGEVSAAGPRPAK